LREKLELFSEAGIERTHVARFDARLAAMPAERFVEEVLVKGLGAAWLLVGGDFRFGAKRAGDFAALERAAASHGFGLEAMPEVTLEGARVSSSAVRAALEAGDFGRAAGLLGRPYTMSGRVAHGGRLGSALGFPTANFVVEAELEETHARLRGVASVGRRPTVAENGPLLLEVNLFDFGGDLYGRHLRVTFLKKLRGEERFDGLEALRAAIARDAAMAREHFERNG
jgi:riboflavin kinase/FMN adenylyltransferase